MKSHKIFALIGLLTFGTLIFPLVVFYSGSDPQNSIKIRKIHIKTSCSYKLIKLGGHGRYYIKYVYLPCL